MCFYVDKFRATGRTTRLADQYIQQLFENPGEWVYISDHYPCYKAKIDLVYRICRRVELEHNIKLDSKKNNQYLYLRIPLDVADYIREVQEKLNGKK